MDFGLLMDTLSLSKMEVSVVLLYFVWYVLMQFMFNSSGKKPGVETNLGGVASQVFFPLAAAVLLAYFSYNLYRPVIVVQGTILIFTFLAMINYVYLYLALSKDKVYLTSNESATVRERLENHSWYRDIGLGLFLGLFVGSHYLDDGVGAFVLLGLLIVGLDTIVEALFPRGSHSQTSNVKYSVLISSLVATGIGFIISSCLSWLVFEEPTLVMTVYGLGLVLAVSFFRYVLEPRRCHSRREFS